MYASHQTATSHVWGMLQDHPAQSSSPGKARLQTHFELIDHKVQATFWTLVIYFYATRLKETMANSENNSSITEIHHIRGWTKCCILTQKCIACAIYHSVLHQSFTHVGRWRREC